MSESTADPTFDPTAEPTFARDRAEGVTGMDFESLSVFADGGDPCDPFRLLAGEIVDAIGWADEADACYDRALMFASAAIDTARRFLTEYGSPDDPENLRTEIGTVDTAADEVNASRSALDAALVTFQIAANAARIDFGDLGRHGDATV